MASKVEIIDKTASLHCFLYESLRKGGGAGVTRPAVGCNKLVSFSLKGVLYSQLLFRHCVPLLVKSFAYRLEVRMS